MAQSMVNMAAMFQNLRIPDNANPVTVTLPSPPELTGALAPNNWLSKARRFASQAVLGPESLAIDEYGFVYTGLANGWVVEVRPNGQVRGLRRMSLNTCGRVRSQEACGRPLGMRLDARRHLLFADAYSGIFKMDRRTRHYIQLVNARTTRVNGKPLGFLNDLDVRRDGTIFFTSSSAKWTSAEYMNIILEGENSGRVLMYNPHIRGPNKVQQIIAGLSFPNGLQLSKDESYLLVAEGARSRIHRVWIGANHPKRGTLEVFADNLPGFVDNIRLSPRGTYWVGLSTVRHADKPSVLDTYGSMPNIRRQIMGMPKDTILAQAPKYGIAVELNEDGKVIRSLHDPEGVLFTAVSEIGEFGGRLYIGTFDRNFIGVLSVNSLPPPIKPEASNGSLDSRRPVGNSGGGGRPSGRPNGQHVVNPKPNRNPDPPSSSKPKPPSGHNFLPKPKPTVTPKPKPSPKPGPNPNMKPPPKPSPGGSGRTNNSPLARMLLQMNRNMDRMNGEQLRDMVLVLLKQVIETKQEANKTLQRAVKLKSDMSQLKQMLGLSKTAPSRSAVVRSTAAASSGIGNKSPQTTRTGNVAQTRSSTGTGGSTGTGNGIATGTGSSGTMNNAGNVVTDTSRSGVTTTTGTAPSGQSGTSPTAGTAGASPNYSGGCVSGSLACGVFK